MKNIDVSERASIAFGHAKALALRLKPLQLSPLAAILLAGLSIMTLAMGLFALYAIFGPSAMDDGATAPDWKPPTLAIVALEPPKPANADVESLSRPIFSKSRRPGRKAVAPTATNESAAPGTLSVTAIIRNKKSAQAFLISSDAPEGAWRKVGDTVEAWTITAIASKEVVLQSGGQTTKVKLYADPAPGDAAAPAAPAAQPPQEQIEPPAGNDPSPAPKLMQ